MLVKEALKIIFLKKLYSFSILLYIYMKKGGGIK